MWSHLPLLTPLIYGTLIPGMRNRTIALGSLIFTGEILHRKGVTVSETMAMWYRWYLTYSNFDIGHSPQVKFLTQMYYIDFPEETF